MSNTAVNCVKQLVVGRSSAKHVLRELADAARDDAHVSRATGKSWPPLHAYKSIPALVKITELNRKTVIDSLKYLKEMKFIRHAGTDGQSNQVQVYELLLNSIDAACDAERRPSTGPNNGISSKNGPGPVLPGPSTAFSDSKSRYFPSGVPKTGHETIGALIQPKDNPKTTRATLSHSLVDEYPDLLSGVDQQVLKDWKALRDKKKAPITKTAIAEIYEEAQKAGLTMNKVLSMCCSKGWCGFESTFAKKGITANSDLNEFNYRDGINENGSITL